MQNTNDDEDVLRTVHGSPSTLGRRTFLGLAGVAGAAIALGSVPAAQARSFALSQRDSTGTLLRGIDVTMRSTSDFDTAFGEIAGWGANTIRLVVHADPNRQGSPGHFQHDKFYKWTNSSGVVYSPPIVGDWDNGDRLVVDTTGWDRLMLALRAAKDAGLSVILDMHSWPGRTNYDFWSNSDPTTVTNTAVPLADADAKGIYFQGVYQSFWTTLLTTYLSASANQDLTDTLVGYDLMNEPDLITDWPDATTRANYLAEMTAGTWVTPSVWTGSSDHNLNYHKLMNDTISTIRTAESSLSTTLGTTVDKTVFVEGWGSYGAAINFGWLEPVSDPNSNLRYSFHMYVPSYFTGQTAATISAGNGSYYPSMAALGDPQDFDATDLAASMDVVVDFLSNNSLDSSLIYVGEFGANYETDDRGGDTWTWDAVDYFESAGWFWTWWSYSVVQKSPQYDASGTLQTTTARLDVLTSYWQGTPVTRPTHTHP